jgi:RNA polymerase sigma-70 factor (ECF subfamily)
MPPHPRWYHGHDAIAEFHIRDVASVRWRHLPTTANGQLAIGCYIFDDARSCFVGSVLDVLTLRGHLISSVTAFFTPEELQRNADEHFVGAVDFSRFGLPQTLPVPADLTPPLER